VASFTEQFPASMRGYPKVIAVSDDIQEVFAVALAMYRNIKSGN
jgi:hypothetical protein